MSLYKTISVLILHNFNIYTDPVVFQRKGTFKILRPYLEPRCGIWQSVSTGSLISDACAEVRTVDATDASTNYPQFP